MFGIGCGGGILIEIIEYLHHHFREEEPPPGFQVCTREREDDHITQRGVGWRAVAAEGSGGDINLVGGGRDGCYITTFCN